MKNPSRVKINSSLRSSQQGCSIKRGAHRNFTKFTGKHQCQSVFFNKVPRLRQLYLKQEFSTGIFLWILRNVWERLFSRTPPDDSFCTLTPWTDFHHGFWPHLNFTLMISRTLLSLGQIFVNLRTMQLLIFVTQLKLY